MRDANEGYHRLNVAQIEWSKILDSQPRQRNNSMAYLSKENLANNQHWGDALEPKEDRTFRVYSQNVNGLTLDRRGGQFDALCRVIKEVQADVMCGQEHQLDTAQYQVKSILYQTCQQHWQRSRMNFGTTAVPFKSMYKPGGTFITTVGNATGRIQSQTADELGRWVSQTFQGAAGRRITFISAYQVVSDVVIPGTTTAASQQKSMLIQRDDPIQAPRKAFRRDLTTFLQKCKDAGEEIMLLGDFNEVMGDDPEGMTAIAQKLELFDVMSSRHADNPPVTYSRGRRCLDFGLATPAIIQPSRGAATNSSIPDIRPITELIFSTWISIVCLALRFNLYPNSSLGCFIQLTLVRLLNTYERNSRHSSRVMRLSAGNGSWQKVIGMPSQSALIPTSPV
jgi:exonuclease III